MKTSFLTKKNTVSHFLGSSLLIAGLALASSALLANSAQALTISFGENSFSSNSPATGASAIANFNFEQSGENVLLNINLENTTGDTIFGAGATESTLVGLGFDFISSITSYNYDALSSPLIKLFGEQTLTSQTVQGNATLQPFGTFDVGIRSAGSGNFTGGNPQTGLAAGESTLVSFLLSGISLDAAKVESNFLSGFQNGTLKVATRFQQVNAGEGSDKLLGGEVVNGGEEPGEVSVPEPTTTLGLIALGGLGLLARKKKALQS